MGRQWPSSAGAPVRPTASMQFYHVTNWERFQHYKDRNPPWIKLHFELLSSMDWVVLDDASRVLAVACMLIASRNNGRVPADPHYMRRVAYLNALPKFKPLIDCGFLEISQADASALQADARPETETETEEESKKTTIVVQKAKRFDLDTFPDTWKQFCQEKRPELNPEEVFQQFADYWTAKAGKDANKLDWFATWRNWVRNQKNQPKGSQNEKRNWIDENNRITKQLPLESNSRLPNPFGSDAKKLR